jgi:hypothetical protein
MKNKNEKHWVELKSCLSILLFLGCVFLFFPAFPAIFLIIGKATTFEWIWLIVSTVVFVGFAIYLIQASSFNESINKAFKEPYEEDEI